MSPEQITAIGTLMAAVGSLFLAISTWRKVNGERDRSGLDGITGAAKTLVAEYRQAKAEQDTRIDELEAQIVAQRAELAQLHEDYEDLLEGCQMLCTQIANAGLVPAYVPRARPSRRKVAA